jgi:predicted house-cleaning NTP pyrophosphatase (Maf/HAM1 superfamily)
MTAAGAGSKLILASGSRARAEMLQAAGLSISIEPADLDELAIENECRARGLDTRQVADALADAKATMCHADIRAPWSSVRTRCSMSAATACASRKPGPRRSKP